MTTAMDLFAGLGGFSLGARKAGVRVVWAANHCPLATRMHAAQHPGAIHVCQDLRQADWTAAPPVDLLLAAPECRGHTRARGADRPHHDASRATAWAVVDAAETVQPRALIVENVPDLRRWALYPVWREALERLGYAVSEQELDAADHGVPQERRRLFVVATQSRHPIRLRLPARDRSAIGPIIDWHGGRWSRVERPGRAQRTIDRVRAGRRVHGDAFVMPYYSSGSGLGGRSPRRPLGTVTTIDRWAAVVGPYMRMLTVSEYRRAMGFPDNTPTPNSRRDAIRLLGNAVCPAVAADLIDSVVKAA